MGGISDLDGDGHKEIVFSSGGSEWGTYIYEHASNEPLAYERVYEAPSFLAYYGLGDTDGNGRMEIIGTTNTYFDDVRTLENTGDNSYDEVLTVPSTSWSRHGAVDVDGDGRTELLHTLTEARNILVIETRSGSELQEVWNSGSLFQESGEDIYAYHGILAIGDSDNNGYPEFAVLQGDQLHILEVVPEPSSAALLCAAAAGLMAYACRKAKCRPRFFRSRCRCRKRRSEPIVVGR